jgi:hypothetical protein
MPKGCTKSLYGDQLTNTSQTIGSNIEEFCQVITALPMMSSLAVMTGCACSLLSHIELFLQVIMR